MKLKKDNNLIKMNYGDDVYYFTSSTRAGLAVGLASASVLWAIRHNNELESYDGKKITFKIVDGSDVPYGLINNNKIKI